MFKKLLSWALVLCLLLALLPGSAFAAGGTWSGSAISGCLNSGKIDCQGSVFIGGILGEDTNESSESISVTGCTNTGEVVPYGDGWSINLAATETMPKEGITLTPVTRTVLVQGDTLTYTYEFPSDGSYADVIAAWYDANGAMQGCTMESIRCSGLRTAALKVKANAAKYKLFLLDSASKPIEIVWES